ncbi:MAG: hypothetical protein AAGG01_14040 [Planctomycetota bacterium]
MAVLALALLAPLTPSPGPLMRPSPQVFGDPQEISSSLRGDLSLASGDLDGDSQRRRDSPG